MKSVFVYITFILSIVTAYGQGDVPDLKFRSYLSGLYPGMIDTNGKLNTEMAANYSGAIVCTSHVIKNMEGIQHFKKITSLNCSFNELDSVPDLSNLTYLRDFICSNNQLKVFPALPATIKRIVMDHNQLTSVPELGVMSNLIELRLNHNKLTKLPSLQAIQGLNYLYVQYNQLTSLPPLTDKLVLYDLICHHNLLTSIPALNGTVGLRTLDCSSNKLTTITSFPNSENSLITVNCSNNALTSLPPFNHIRSLSQFNCSNNKLAELPVLSGLMGLEVLTCSNNKLSALPAMQECISLATIRLDSNEFRTVPVFQLEKIQYIDLSYNQLESIDALPYLNSPAGGTGRIDLTYNHLTFGDLKMYAQMDSSVYRFFPQRPFELGSGPIQLKDGESYSVSIPFDQDLSSNTYYWKVDGKTVDVTTTGNYEVRGNVSLSVEIKNSLPGFAKASLNSTELEVYTNACANNECDEFVLSPNGDGVGDLYRVDQTGLVEIMNREGRIIKSMTAPAVWTGDDQATGYFIVFLNGTKVAAVTLVR